MWTALILIRFITLELTSDPSRNPFDRLSTLNFVS
jgi:hypothetical protein